MGGGMAEGVGCVKDGSVCARGHGGGAEDEVGAEEGEEG